MLEVRWIGLFEIQEVLHNACHLCLPSILKIHPVINVAFLKLAVTIVSSDLKCAILSNLQDMAEKEWNIKAIIAHKHQGQ